MNIIRDRIDKSQTVVLENFNPNQHDIECLTSFVYDVLSTPEAIGGIYFYDLQDRQHNLELKNQSLYALLSVVNSFAFRVPLHIRYDTDKAPAEIVAEILHLPAWLIRLFRISMTFSECVKHAVASAKISKSIPKQ